MRNLPLSSEADPADETLMTGAEYESRVRLKLLSATGRAELLAEIEKAAGACPEWLKSELGLCPKCGRPNCDTDRLTCELCREGSAEEERDY